jgi:UDP-N-acetylglucosamine:LPS N-acetylglucosamine transferase
MKWLRAWIINIEGFAGNVTQNFNNRPQSVLRSDKMRLLVILGEGGHTAQLLNLVELLGNNYDYYYVVSKEDDISASRIKCPGPIYRVSRPRGKSTGKLAAVLKTFWVGVQSLGVLWRVRPDAVVSAGPAIAVPISIMGKLFSAQIIFVESASRVSTISLTGRIMYKWADLFFVQWPDLQEKLPRALYAGRLV